MTVTVATPLALVAGVKVSVPPLSAGCTAKSAALSLLTLTLVMLWTDSFAGPGKTVAKPLVEKAPLSSSTTTLFVVNISVGA